MLSLYAATVPAFMRGLGALTGYVDVASAFASESGTDPTVLVGARLVPGMMSLAGQIQAACDNAKNGVARLIGAEAPRFDDNEKTLSDLRSRIERTVDILAGVTPHHFEGAEARTIVLGFDVVSGPMTGRDYAIKLLIPNFYFHVSMAHGILRHRGLRIGKKNYLGDLADASLTVPTETA